MRQHIGEREIRVLDALDVPKKRQKLAAELGYEPGTITNVVSQLEAIGLIIREKEGNETLVRPTNTRCLEVYQALTRTNPHIDFPELLTSSMVEVLYYLRSTEGVSAAELAEESGVSRATVYRNLKTLTNRAMVVTEHSHYRLTDRFAELHEFVYELRHRLHRARIQNDLESGTIVWESYDEFLVRTENMAETSQYLRTGLDAFSTFGLDFFTPSGQYYFYSEDRESLTPADLVAHLLLIENDARHRKYAMLLVASTEISHDEVRETASFYGIEGIVSPLLEYLRTRGEQSSAQMPPWEEMESLASDYEVDL